MQLQMREWVSVHCIQACIGSALWGRGAEACSAPKVFAAAGSGGLWLAHGLWRERHWPSVAIGSAAATLAGSRHGILNRQLALPNLHTILEASDRSSSHNGKHPFSLP